MTKFLWDVVDRQIRPLFPKYIRHDIQVILMPLSYDREHEHDMLAGIAASAALSISDIPWNGPSANVRVGLIDGEFVLNPTPQQRELSDLDLVVATSDKDVVMIEAGAKEVSEEKCSKGLNLVVFGEQKLQLLLLKLHKNWKGETNNCRSRKGYGTQSIS